MLQVLLGEHPQVATTVEMTLYRFYAAPWLEAWDMEKRNSTEGRWHQGLPFVWERDRLKAFLQDFTAQVYRQLLDGKPGATHVLDKHPPNAMHVGLIRDFWPNARFIHMIRDGRDVVCSMISAARKMGYGTTTIASSARSWRDYVAAARKAAEFGDDYLEVRYEDLLRDGASAYTKVLDFCRLPYATEWLESTLAANTFEKMKSSRRTGNPEVQSRSEHYRKGRAGTWKEEHSTLDAFEVDREAGDLLRQLGYADDRNWWKATPLDSALYPALSTLRNLASRVRSWRPPAPSTSAQ